MIQLSQRLSFALLLVSYYMAITGPAGVWAFSHLLPHSHRITTLPKAIRSKPTPSSVIALFAEQQPQQQGDGSTKTKNAVLEEANDALYNVGWAPIREEGELTSTDPFVQEIDAGIQRDFGVPLDELLNPAKVVNLERDLYNLRLELAQMTGVTLDQNQQQEVKDGGETTASAPSSPPFTKTNTALTTEMCDGGGGGDEADAIRAKIQKKEKDLLIERRSVFRGWLKNVFLVQAVLSFGLSYVMATQPEVLFGGFGWYGMYNMDISIQVLGYWWWWLFVVPSLRSRRPKGMEKKALDMAFVATPLVSLIAPAATRDTGIIWAANFAVVAASYAFAFATGDNDDGDDDSNTPEWLKFVYKSLDFGSGRERGARN